MLLDATGPNATIVAGAIRHAAKATGTDFQYLLATAQVESNFNPTAQVATSSARGLFQFIEQTWLATLKEQGPALGYGRYANAITRGAGGQYVVTEPRLYDAIMNLRADPTANALMAGAFTRANAAQLSSRLGREPSEAELYIAHFLGPTGASKLIGLADSMPQASAAAVFPGAAQANPAIFYDRRGRARGVGEVYRLLAGRYQVARGGRPPPTATAPTTVAESAATKPRKPYVLDAAKLAETYAAAARSSGPAAPPDSGPMFHGLFRSHPQRGAVAPVVSALWGAPAPVVSPPANAAPVAVAQDTAAPSATAPSATTGALDLFQEQLPDARALFRGRV